MQRSEPFDHTYQLHNNSTIYNREMYQIRSNMLHVLYITVRGMLPLRWLVFLAYRALTVVTGASVSLMGRVQTRTLSRSSLSGSDLTPLSLYQWPLLPFCCSLQACHGH
ncbi:hypothetical protein M427DRAFT_194459 [Gonapodya prolifera JEL478]|uniref:Uncharacterized protein n=1 Tax=Gonapodya prolifera (strain JEL478) TaxID=1344416 RepID=A0A139AP90_GONPJ|nr:hypothetical protein M427DRAFT_194459 [Gonapodya prolifera JEL478]|eukprot:KXS18560.1 hypothetical protein M427DRAFT_194459 [Gonapodya prolifera JEL478]